MEEEIIEIFVAKYKLKLIGPYCGDKEIVKTENNVFIARDREDVVEMIDMLGFLEIVAHNKEMAAKMISEPYRIEFRESDKESNKAMAREGCTIEKMISMLNYIEVSEADTTRANSGCYDLNISRLLLTTSEISLIASVCDKFKSPVERIELEKRVKMAMNELQEKRKDIIDRLREEPYRIYGKQDHRLLGIPDYYKQIIYRYGSDSSGDGGDYSGFDNISIGLWGGG